MPSHFYKNNIPFTKKEEVLKILNTFEKGLTTEWFYIIPISLVGVVVLEIWKYFKKG